MPPPRAALREAAEHVCSGVYLWIGRTIGGQASWMVDDEPLGLLTVLEQLPAEPAGWVIDQTLKAAAPALAPRARVLRGSVDDLLATVRMQPRDRLELDPAVAEVAGLASELAAVARAGASLAAQLRQALLAPLGESSPSAVGGSSLPSAGEDQNARPGENPNARPGENPNARPGENANARAGESPNATDRDQAAGQLPPRSPPGRFAA